MNYIDDMCKWLFIEASNEMRPLGTHNSPVQDIFCNRIRIVPPNPSEDSMTDPARLGLCDDGAVEERAVVDRAAAAPLLVG